MRLLLPSRRLRRQIVGLLVEFFDTHDEIALRVATQLLGEFYHLPPPRVTLHDSLHNPRILGDCDDQGNIRLMTPEAWQRRRTDNDAHEWVLVALHEIAHWQLWAVAEPKADVYALRFLEDAT